MRLVTNHLPRSAFALSLTVGTAFAVLAADPPLDPEPVPTAADTAAEPEHYVQKGHFPEEVTDADGDGVADIDDNCPGTTLGKNGVGAVDACGCPTTPKPLFDPCILDSDHDGVGDCQDKCPNTYSGHRVGADGCPLPLGEPVRMRVDVKFEFDRWRIQPGYDVDLLHLRDTLLRYPEIRLRLEGHTDFTGPEAYNQKLSQQRAEACRDFVLQGGGIDPSRVEAVGFGESKPIADNHTTEGRAANRRTVVEFSFEHTLTPANDQPPPTGTMAPENN